MANKLVGYKKSEFEIDGKNYSGVNLFMTYKSDKIQGDGVSSVFVSDKKMGDYVPRVGQYVDIRYNKFGKVESVSEIKA